MSAYTDIRWADIEAAHARVAPHIHRTPILTCRSIDALAGCSLFFKCENFQKIGAFKIRGGMNAALTLPADEAQRGLATHSSGNHAQAVAYAARQLGVKAYIVMPENSPAVKVNAVRGYGAEVIFCAPNQAAREATLQEIVARTGAAFIHPYDDDRVICGQATCAKELLEDVPGLEAVIAPVGGGGLLSGTCLSAHHLAPNLLVYAGEPEGAADAVLSLRSGRVEKAPYINTIADGLLTTLSERTLRILSRHVREIFTVSDAEILAALRLVYERMKIVIEPSCAVPLAAVLKHPEAFAGKRVGIILTGGNVDLSRLGAWFGP
ncbi:MAG: pyridoxal-phosphate dependent enzyme [Saprospiraceae bacterium]|nr:pyridoxal-phosphate dependent enzyme [Saprospiraceae bacterium]MDW8229003.1 pyridoxal-phosphate dependent enzyme [Saprospiraceae bacterium]